MELNLLHLCMQQVKLQIPPWMLAASLKIFLCMHDSLKNPALQLLSIRD